MAKQRIADTHLPGRRLAGWVAALAALAAIGPLACAPGNPPGETPDRTDLATRYAAAWSGQDPGALAAFYAEDGVLQVNDGEPAVGRAAIAEKARGFMEAFPDMVVALDAIEADGDRAVFRWRWTGTHTGPGGTGRAVDLRGYEEWTIDADGRIARSLGHYDEAEYRRQIGEQE